MSRALQARLSRLEGAATNKTGASVWFPGEPRPTDWDTADIQVSFPPCGCCDAEEP